MNFANNESYSNASSGDGGNKPIFTIIGFCLKNKFGALD